VPIEDIKREAQVVTRLKDGEQHKNLVRILDHGWLKNVPSVYFIDMELCDLTLHEYIVYLHGPTQNIIEECFPSMSWETDAVFVSRTSPLMARIRNIWEIGIHIASGLEFMHRCGLVHRDLKPKNGTAKARFEG
jgi:serine/threonine protein kinase